MYMVHLIQVSIEDKTNSKDFIARKILINEQYLLEIKVIIRIYYKLREGHVLVTTQVFRNEGGNSGKISL